MVADQLITLLPSGESRAAAVAQRRNMSTRSFTRQLAKEGTTFAEILERLRRRLASRYLAHDRMSIKQIAWLLGYSQVGRSITPTEGGPEHRLRERDKNSLRVCYERRSPRQTVAICMFGSSRAVRQRPGSAQPAKGVDFAEPAAEIVSDRYRRYWPSRVASPSAYCCPQRSLLSRVGAVPCWGGSCHSFRQLLGRGVPFRACSKSRAALSKCRYGRAKPQGWATI